jgi:hypothetical protein
MANDGFIEFLSPNALIELEKASKVLDKMVGQISTINTFKMPTSPSGSDKAIKDMNNAYAQYKTTIESLTYQLYDLATQRKNEDTVVRTQILTKRELQKQVDSEIKTNLQVIGLYGRINAELNVLKGTYRDLALKKELGEQLNKKEQDSLTKSLDKLTKYDQALKKVDATMGVHGRSVGNYASGFNPLSNSISQITRELPNFGQSMQIGILSLTNNIGAFQDAITGLKAQNKMLQEEGKATKSVFSQVGAAFMSWNTLLYVGIGLLSAYGKEIGNFVSSLFEGSKALDELNKKQKEFNNSRLTGTKDAQAEILELRKYLAVINDKNLTDEQQKIAQDALLKQYPYYIRNVNDAIMANGKYSQGVNDLITALEKRKEVEKKTELNVANKQNLIDLQNELELNKENLATTIKNFEAAKKSGGLNAQTANIFIDAKNKLIKRSIELDKEIPIIQKQIIKNDADIIKLKKETIGLEYQEEKVKKDKKQRLEREINIQDQILKNEYDYKIRQLEIAKKIQEEIFNNEQKTYAERLAAREKFSKLSLELIDLKNNREIAIEKDKATQLLKNQEEARIKDLKDNAENVKNGFADKRVQIENRYAENVKTINYNLAQELLKIDINYSEETRDLQNVDLAFFKKIQKEKDKLTKETADIYFQMAQERRLKDSNNENRSLTQRQASFESWKSMAEAQLFFDEALAKSNSNQSPEQIAKITAEFDKLRNSINETISPLRKFADETKDWLNDFSSSFASDAGFSQTFKIIENDFFKNIDNAFKEGLITREEQYASYFNGITEMAQEAYNFLNQMSQQNFDAEYERLEQQKNIALLFAGDSASAKAEIEEQYEQKRKEIARREAKAKKQQAIMNIAIDTAQAIVAAVAKFPLTGGLPWSAIAAAIGAAQIAMVASQQIPQYWKGTDNAEGGLAWTQERGREIITDSQGRVKSLGSDKGAELTMLSKGDKVFTAEKSAMMFDNSLNSMLLNNGIVMPKVEVSMDTKILGSKLDKLSDTIASKESFTIVRDAKGERIYQRKQNERKELLNNILNVKTYGV